MPWLKSLDSPIGVARRFTSFPGDGGGVEGDIPKLGDGTKKGRRLFNSKTGSSE